MGKPVAESQEDIDFTLYNINPEWEFGWTPGWTKSPNFDWIAGKMRSDWGADPWLRSDLFDWPAGTYVKLQVSCTDINTTHYNISIIGGPAKLNLNTTGVTTIEGFLDFAGGGIRIIADTAGMNPYIEFDWARAYYKPYDEVLATLLGWDFGMIPLPRIRNEYWSRAFEFHTSRLAHRNTSTNIIISWKYPV